jgi:single-stranded-DNA-specific exonuclease
MQVTGLSQQRQALPPEAIGFGLGPRINAVGRLAQPAVVIDLLTTEDAGLALERAMQCEQLNQQRRELCRCIELEAIAQVEASNVDLAGDRVLAVLGEGWHHGVIGIVASRLLERYGVPVFIGAVEGNDIRGSARGIPEFDVFQALQACAEVFHKFGGHTAAGGFSMAASQWPNLCEGLRAFAGGVLQPEHLRPALAIDVEAGLPALDLDFFERMQQLQPFGVGNREPVFWSRNLRVSNCRQIGKDRDHLKFQVLPPDSQRPRQAIAWRGGDWSPLPERVDVAYCLRKQDWRGEVAIELEVKGIRATVPDPIVLSATKTPAPSVQLHYRAAPPVPYALQWQSCDSLSDCLEACNGTVLIYGFERPHLKASNGAIHYDRPQPEQVYDALVLWSLPPSLTHLRWLLAAATPARPSGHCIYLHSQSVPLPTASNLQQQLTDHLHCGDRVDLLRLGQQWWVAPSTLVAGLRSLGIPCATFGPTGELAEELAKLERWFCRSVTDVAAIVERCS